MPKIPEISVGIQMERSVSVSSDRNIPIEILWSGIGVKIKVAFIVLILHFMLYFSNLM